MDRLYQTLGPEIRCIHGERYLFYRTSVGIPAKVCYNLLLCPGWSVVNVLFSDLSFR